MAYVVQTFTAFQVLTAAQMNQIQDDLDIFVIGTPVQGTTGVFHFKTSGAEASLGTAGLSVVASGVTPQFDASLHVLAGTSGAQTYTGMVVFEHSASAYLTMATADANNSGLLMGSLSQVNTALVDYNYSGNTMRVGTNRASAKVTFLDQATVEVMRLSGTGLLWVGVTGAFENGGHGSGTALSNTPGWNAINSHATTPHGLQIAFTGGAPDDNTQFFIRCRDNASGGTTRGIEYADGDWANHDGTYGTISSLLTKYRTSITPARSYWNDLKRVRFLKYKSKSDGPVASAPWRFGVVAEELREVFPALYHEGALGEPAWVDTMTLMQLFARGTQEAIVRIEKMDARITHLERRLSAANANQPRMRKAA